MAELKGINLAMQTPFDDMGAVDYGRWEELIDIYIDAGVHGLVLGAGTGQHPYLTEDECNKLYETGIRRIDGRCNSICQTSALNVNEVIRRSKHSEGAGADALMILPPYLEGPADDEGLFRFYADIDSEIRIDIVGYNIPQTTGLSVSVPLYKRLNTLVDEACEEVGRDPATLARTVGVLIAEDGADPWWDIAPIDNIPATMGAPVLKPLNGTPADIASVLRMYVDEGVSTIQIHLDGVTPKTIEKLVPVLEAFDAN